MGSQTRPINRMLINATQQEEVRIALTSDQFLENIFIEEFGSHRTGNIYKGRVTRIVPSLQAAFVDFGSERHGFLPLKEVAPEYFQAHVNPHEDHYNISDALVEGQEVLIQVEKEERGNKGAAITTFITLAGCYLVLMPNNPRAGGISRRIEGDDRDQLRDLMDALNVPEGMGLIIRTAGVGRSVEELQWDLNILLRLWEAIKEADGSQAPPCLIHQESDIVIRAFRDYLRKDVDEIIIDDENLYQRAYNHLSKIKPEILHSVKNYNDKALPLFSRYHIENQIETAFQRDVRLPSGGFIVIQETEALVAIDVNSARDTKSDDIEQTAFNTNREAAIEVARQLRLRDLGGLIVVDFIDMSSNDHQQQIVDIFSSEIQHDKARVQFSRISRFGLLEVSRQRLRPSLREASQIVCPRCAGQGSIRSVESLALHILRLIRHEAMNDNIAEVIIYVPIDVSAFLLNEKRHVLDEIEQHQKVALKIIPTPHLETPQYKLERVYETQSGSIGKPSYSLQEKPSIEVPTSVKSTATSSHEPVIKQLETPTKPAAVKTELGLVERLIRWFKSKKSSTPAKTRSSSHHRRHGHQNRNRHRQHQGQQRRGGGGGHHRNSHQHGQGGGQGQGQGQRRSSQRRHPRQHNASYQGKGGDDGSRLPSGNYQTNTSVNDRKSDVQQQQRAVQVRVEPIRNPAPAPVEVAVKPITPPVVSVPTQTAEHKPVAKPVQQSQLHVFEASQPIGELPKAAPGFISSEVEAAIAQMTQQGEKPGAKARQYQRHVGQRNKLRSATRKRKSEFVDKDK